MGLVIESPASMSVPRFCSGTVVRAGVAVAVATGVPAVLVLVETGEWDLKIA